MTRLTAKVVLFDLEIIPGTGTFDYVEIRRSANGLLAVWRSKYHICPLTKQALWEPWVGITGLKGAKATQSAIIQSLEQVGAVLELENLFKAIAQIDWLTAAVMAQHSAVALPALPNFDVLRAQRAWRKLGNVTIHIEFGYEMQKLVLPFDRWLSILCGERWLKQQPYWYEGQRLTAFWSFDGAGHLVVGYNDGGICWEGLLRSLIMIEGQCHEGVDIAKLVLQSPNAMA